MDKKFQNFILPKSPLIQPSLNNLSFDNHHLLRHQKSKTSILSSEALNNFLEYLWQVSEEMNNWKIILMAHNGDEFDFKMLFKSYKEQGVGLDQLSIIEGCLDSFHLLRHTHPHLESHEQEELARKFLSSKENFSPQSALQQSVVLQKIVVKMFTSFTYSQVSHAFKLIKPIQQYYC